jgi:hypothetical protein
MNSEPQTARISLFHAMTTSGWLAIIETGAGITRPEGRVRLRILRGLNSMKLHPAA